MRTIIEPFRIKMVEPIPLTTRDERERDLRRGRLQPVSACRAEDVIIDLLTDSGTSRHEHASSGRR